MPGRQSYSAQIVTCSGPAPARAENAVGSSQIPRSTLKPAPSSVSQEPSAGLLFLEAELGMGVDAMAQRQQPVTALLDGGSRRLSRIHDGNL